jgi:hypothetical protein
MATGPFKPLRTHFPSTNFCPYKMAISFMQNRKICKMYVVIIGQPCSLLKGTRNEWFVTFIELENIIFLYIFSFFMINTYRKTIIERCYRILHFFNELLQWTDVIFINRQLDPVTPYFGVNVYILLIILF